MESVFALATGGYLIDLLQSCSPLRHDRHSEDWARHHVSLEGLQRPRVNLLCHSVMHLFNQRIFVSGQG